jgi:hypothetical protein
MNTDYIAEAHLKHVKSECYKVAITVIARHKRASHQTTRIMVSNIDHALFTLDLIGQNDFACQLRSAISRAESMKVGA